MDPVSDLEPVRVPYEHFDILSVADVKALLRSAEAESPAAAAAYAIAVFGGIRMAELGRLTWGRVGADNIEIDISKAMKPSPRLIPICPTLRVWIDATRRESEDNALIVPPNWTAVSKSVRRRAGWDVATRLLPAKILKDKPTRGAWPSEACRYTCVSMQVYIGTPRGDQAVKFGYSREHDHLRRHFVSRLTKKDALAILAIGPNGSKIENI